VELNHREESVMLPDVADQWHDEYLERFLPSLEEGVQVERVEVHVALLLDSSRVVFWSGQVEMLAYVYRNSKRTVWALDDSSYAILVRTFPHAIVGKCIRADKSPISYEIIAGGPGEVDYIVFVSERDESVRPGFAWDSWSTSWFLGQCVNRVVKQEMTSHLCFRIVRDQLDRGFDVDYVFLDPSGEARVQSLDTGLFKSRVTSPLVVMAGSSEFDEVFVTACGVRLEGVIQSSLGFSVGVSFDRSTYDLSFSFVEATTYLGRCPCVVVSGSFSTILPPVPVSSLARPDVRGPKWLMENLWDCIEDPPESDYFKGRSRVSFLRAVSLPFTAEYSRMLGTFCREPVEGDDESYVAFWKDLSHFFFLIHLDWENAVYCNLKGGSFQMTRNDHVLFHRASGGVYTAWDVPVRSVPVSDMYQSQIEMFFDCETYQLPDFEYDGADCTAILAKKISENSVRILHTFADALEDSSFSVEMLKYGDDTRSCALSPFAHMVPQGPLFLGMQISVGGIEDFAAQLGIENVPDLLDDTPDQVREDSEDEGSSYRGVDRGQSDYDSDDAYEPYPFYDAARDYADEMQAEADLDAEGPGNDFENSGDEPGVGPALDDLD